MNTTSQHKKTLKPQQSKLLKHIQTINKQIIKNYQSKHSAILKMQSILGMQYAQTQCNKEQTNQNKQKLFFNSNQPNLKKDKSCCNPLISLSDQQILYYACKYFVIFNLSTKEYQIINKDIKNCNLVQIKKFNTSNNDQKLIVCIYQTQFTKENTYIGLLTLKTDYQSRTSRNDSRYQWKAIKLYTQPVSFEDFTYFSKKNYLYFVITNFQNNIIQSDQFLWIYDLTKQIMLVNQQIKSNTVGFYIKTLSLQDFNTVYLVGKNYFRQWTVNFNQRNIKESNVRNVERALKGKKLVDLQQIQKYSLKPQSHIEKKLTQIPEINLHLQHASNQHILTQPSKLLLILTETQLLLVKNNQLICSIKPQKNLQKTVKNKDNIEKQLQNSFNQIYKMKFLFDEYEELKNRQQNYRKNKSKNTDTVIINQKQRDVRFSCISKYWKSQNQNLYFGVATNTYNVLIYELIDFQLKLYTEYSYSKQIVTSPFRTIIPSQAGDLLLIMSQNKQVQLINQENYDPEDDHLIKSLWGNGQMHCGKVYALASPVVQNIMCSVGQDGTFKLWSLKKNERSILFQQKNSAKPLGITIHPGGTMIGVNFQRQIKLFSILPKQFYQITSIKTNYSSLQLKYSQRGEFLVSNQGSVLIFYEPFSLKTIGYIEPADLKCRIVDFVISKNAEYICFLTQEGNTFFQPIDIGQLSKWDHFEPAHRQDQIYTTFSFDFYNMSENNDEKNSVDDRKFKNLFVGATKTKYMVLYDNLGTKLIAQFPVSDCYIVDMQIHENLLFAATSKGTIRIYNWPILEQDLQMQIVNLQQKQIRYKNPRFEEFQVWNQTIQIKKIHKLRFCNEIVVVNESGNMAVVSFQQIKNRKIVYEQVSGQRKKMQQLINQMFYIKKSQAQKRNKLIQKTQNDILKVQNQILREKISLQRKMQEEEISVEKGFDIKNSIQQNQKKEYIQKENKQIQALKRQIQIKSNKLQQLKQFVLRDYDEKKLYEKGRNQGVSVDIKDIILKHKDRIAQKMQSHKENIKDKKKQYFLKVKQTQKQFQDEIQTVYQTKLNQLASKDSSSILKNTDSSSKMFAEMSINSLQDKLMLSHQRNSSSTKLKRMSSYNVKQRQNLSMKNILQRKNIKSMQQQLNEEIILQFTSKQNQQIIVQTCRVEQLQTHNCELERQIESLKKKVLQMQNEDETLQKQFQKNLQEYNLSRFQNLNLHSEVLKMQNQLIQRKQVLDNKEEIVMLAYQQKEKLQNYKQLVKGSLTKQQQKKQGIRDVFFKKQNDLNVIFSELVNQIHKMQNKKCQLQKLQGRLAISQKQNDQKQSLLNQVIDKLKQIKKYLLLEQMNQQKSQKSIQQYEQCLLTTINFLKKRLFMESIKQKKNKQLKKSALNQILKQNKNLLEQCNQLRSEGIEYENQIKNLSNKLKEANKMISIQTKLKSQKSQVNDQKNQLAVIKKLFKMQLNQFGEEDGQNAQNGQTDESLVHYDAEKSNQIIDNRHQININTNTKGNRVMFKTPKTFYQQESQRADHTEYKPFKLSGYIQAQPFERIDG